jgi:hypothetical protein
MSRTSQAVLLAGVMALFVGRLGFAQGTQVAQAVTHAQLAVAQGKARHADSLVVHAKEALTHAQAADKENSSIHTQAAIKSLNEAIEHGKLGHADIATKRAQVALAHLQMIK